MKGREYPKRVKRELKELVGQAYENELGRELGKLALHNMTGVWALSLQFK